MPSSQSLSKARFYVYVIIVIVVIWLLSGIIFSSSDSNQSDVIEDTQTKAQTVIEVTRIEQQTVPRTTEIYGVTQAQRDVKLSAKTQGEVVAVLAREGEFVKQGTPIVRIDMQDRKERLTAAKALVKQRVQEYEAALTLKERGFESDVSLARAGAALDAAKAERKAIEMDIGFTTIRAPFSGILEKINVEQGDFAGVGVFGVDGSIARILDLDPLLAVGEVTQQQRSALSKHSKARIIFPDGSEKQAIVSYIAQAATDASRSFPIEASIPNKDYTLAAGISVTIELSLGQMPAHIVPSSLLNLDDEGTLSIKALDDALNVVAYPVEVISETQRGVVVSGLPKQVRIISSGQNFVSIGETISQERIRTALQKPLGKF